MDNSKKIKLELSWRTIQIISAAIQELPFRVASPVLAEMQSQIDAQNNVVPINPERDSASA